MTKIQMLRQTDACLPHPEGKTARVRQDDGAVREQVMQVKTALFDGQNYDVPDAEAKRLVRNQDAVALGGDGKPKKAAAGAPEDKAAAAPSDTKEDAPSAD